MTPKSLANLRYKYRRGILKSPGAPVKTCVDCQSLLPLGHPANTMRCLACRALARSRVCREAYERKEHKYRQTRTSAQWGDRPCQVCGKIVLMYVRRQKYCPECATKQCQAKWAEYGRTWREKRGAHALPPLPPPYSPP